MWNRLVRVAAPAVSPLTVAEAAQHLRFASGYDVDTDPEGLQDLIDAAVATIDGPKGWGIALVRQTWRLSLDGFEDPIEIPLGPVSSVDSVQYIDMAGDAQTLTAVTDYQASTDREPAIVSPAYGTAWPSARRQPGAVTVEFMAGYGTTAASVPADLRRALKLLVGHFNENREAVAALEAGQLAVLPLGVAAVHDRYAVTAF